jgi:uncharacterized membrane protein
MQLKIPKNKPKILDVFFAIGSVMINGLIINLPIPLFWRMIALLYLVFFLPGYTLLSLLLTRQDNETKLWKITLILPVSIAVVSLITLLLNYFSLYQKNNLPILVIFTVDLFLSFTVAMRGGFAFSEVKRWFLKIKPIRLNRWQILLLLSIVFLIATSLYAIFSPRHFLPLTEFYILTSKRELPSIVTQQDLENSGFIIGIDNHEGRDILYRVKAIARTDIEQKEIWSGSYLVNANQTREIRLSFEESPANTKEIKISLYVDDKSEPYRSLNLLINRVEEVP